MTDVQTPFLGSLLRKFCSFFSVKGAVFIKFLLCLPKQIFIPTFCTKIKCFGLSKFLLLFLLENTGTALEWWFFFAVFIHVFFFLAGGTCPAAILFLPENVNCDLPESRRKYLCENYESPEGCAWCWKIRRDVPSVEKSGGMCPVYMRTRRDVPGVKNPEGSAWCEPRWLVASNFFSWQKGTFSLPDCFLIFGWWRTEHAIRRP